MEKSLKFKVLYLFLMSLFFFSCSKEEITQKNTQKSSDFGVDINSLTIDSNGLSTSYSIIKTAYGNIVFKYYPKHAPNTSTRVISLIKSGFYDGLNFHRVLPGYIVQTGDPTNTGRGGSGQLLKAEFNKLQHIRGTIAMARKKTDVDSADSQFYISLATLPHLDEKYTVFAQVVDGLELLDKIKEKDKIISIEYIE